MLSCHVCLLVVAGSVLLRTECRCYVSHRLTKDRIKEIHVNLVIMVNLYLQLGKRNSPAGGPGNPKQLISVSPQFSFISY